MTRLVRAVIGEIPDADLRRLPYDCVVALAEPDIQAAAVALLRCDLAQQGMDSETAELARQLALLYATASVRLSQLQAAAR